jgi:hypothetical protein
MSLVNYEEIRQRNIEEYGKGTRHLAYLSDLYENRTHFLYELLQNAEDALAKRKDRSDDGYVEIRLHEDRLELRHNGNPFDEQDVIGICGIGEGAKAGDYSQIGKFGIGLKSVYAYTLAPRIHSNGEHFEVRRFVEPHALPEDTGPKNVKPTETCIVLPFDSPPETQAFRAYVSPQQAVLEIGQALKRLGLRTLLFLRCIDKIRWALPDGAQGVFMRETRAIKGKPTARYVDVTDDHTTETWLLFLRETEVTDEGKSHKVAVEVGYLVQDGKVIRAKNTELAVSFPTAKRTELGFLIQGPFKTTKSRAEIALDNEANQQLIKTAAQLAADSLEDLRDLGLLHIESINALPLQSRVFEDEGTHFFLPVYQAIREALNSKRLLPRHGGDFVAAHEARLAHSAQLADVFSAEQLGALFGVDRLYWLDTSIKADRMRELHDYLAGKRKQWPSNEWEQEPLVAGIEIEAKDVVAKLTTSFMEAQDESWLVGLYEYLDKNFETYRSAPFVRLESGRHVTSSKAFLPPPDSAGIDTTVFPLVKQSLVENQDILMFLRNKAMLREPDAVDVVIKCLLPKYRSDTLRFDPTEYERDLKHIIAACVGEGQLRMTPELKRTRFLACVPASTPESDDVVWMAPGNQAVLIRSPELDAWFADNSDDEAWFLHSSARQLLNNRIGDLEVARQSPVIGCDPGNRGKIRLQYTWGSHRQGLDGFNPDAQILGLNFALPHWNPDRARYLWTVLLEIPHLLKGEIQEESNANRLDAAPRKTIHSSMGQACVDAAWLPDQDGKPHKPQDMLLSNLPDGFEKSPHRAETLARALGMKQPVDLAPLAQAHGMTPQQIEQRLALTDEEVSEAQKRRSEVHDFPDKQSPSPDRRCEKVREKAREAPRKTTSRREQSVQDGYPEDKTEAKEYLRGQYSAQDGKLFCQLGHEPMPFKLIDRDEWHFEAVECVPDAHSRYPENFLALSPHYAALFKYANHDRDRMRELIRNAETQEIQVRLADGTYTLRFTSQHLDDLKAVLDVDAESSDQESRQ